MVPTNLEPIHMGSQVPLMLASPNMEANSQHLSLEKPSKYDYLSLKSNLDYFMQTYSRDLCQESGLAICLTKPSTQVPILTFQKCCHAGNLRLGTPCEVGSLNFHALNG